MKKSISFRTVDTKLGPRDFICVDGVLTDIYTIPRNFAVLRKFARDYKDDIIAFMQDRGDDNTGFIFYMCGYSGPAGLLLFLRLMAQRGRRKRMFGRQDIQDAAF